MTNQVLLTVAGLQFLDGEEEVPVELVTTGSYYYRNNKHYILYDEVVEGYSEHIQTTVKIAEDKLEIIKKGLSRIHMEFEKNSKSLSAYNTPFGDLSVGILTHQIEIQESEWDIHVRVNYSLDINEKYLAACSIQLHVKSKEAKDFRLR